jgi:ABC-type branched-subunit amino acid transport system ATPase component
MLEIKNLSKNFDGVQAVSDFSLTLQPRKITSLIGPNGAGKTTVFNVVTGFFPPTSGMVRYESQSVVGLSPWKIARLGISRTFQNLRLFHKLSALENVLLGRQDQNGERFLDALLSFTEKTAEHQANVEKAMSLLEFVGMAGHRAELAENLSYGQQKLLSIACCLASDPELLLLDEPVSGVQPAMIEKVDSILRELVEKQAKTVFLIEHDIEFVLRISDTVVVMDDGKKIAEGEPPLIRNNTEILEAYLS